MTKICLSFEAETEDELLQLVLSYAFKQKKPPSWLGAPLDAEAVQAETEAREQTDAEDLVEDTRGNGADHAPEPEPESAPTPELKRKPRRQASPPVPAPPPPPVDLPPLDTLKSVVTSAVRLAQKGEGSRTILDLLPGFKDATGLAFVMNADDKHRAALYALIQAAGLPVV